jgi:hypothetical protein
MFVIKKYLMNLHVKVVPMYQDMLSRKREKCETLTGAEGRKETKLTHTILSFLFQWGVGTYIFFYY